MRDSLVIMKYFKKAKSIGNFTSSLEVVANSNLISWQRHCHDGASSKDGLAQSVQHSFVTFQFYAQHYDNMDPK